MPSFGRPHSYSLILSAVAGIYFSPGTLAQVAPPESAIVQQQRSIAIQQQSVERQRSAAGGISNASHTANPFALPDAGVERPYPSKQVASDCSPPSQMVLQSVIQKAATDHKVSASLINAVIRQESGGNPCAVSEKGAIGLMQLMPATAQQMGATQPFDVIQNISAGTRLLAELMQRYHGDLNRVLGAYNAGTAAVDRAAGPPPFPETLNYIRSILEQIKQPYAPKLFASPVR